MKNDMPGYGEDVTEQMFGRQNDLSDGIAEMQAVFNNMGNTQQGFDEMCTNDKLRESEEERVLLYRCNSGCVQCLYGLKLALNLKS